MNSTKAVVLFAALGFIDKGVATAQGLPSPRLVHRIDFDNLSDIERKTLLKVVNIGDRGSINTQSIMNHVTTDEKDGFDDFALLFYNKNFSVSFGQAKIWLYDGRTGERLKTSAGAPVEYLFDPAVFSFHGGGMCADGGKDLTGDAWPDLVVGAPGYSQGGQHGAIYILNLRQPDPANVQTIVNPNAIDRNFGASVAILGDFLGGPRAELLVGAPDTNYGGPTGFRGRVYILDLDNSHGQTPAYVHCAIDGFNPWLNIDPPSYNPSSTGFGTKVALVGPIATKSGGVNSWDGVVDRTPEFIVSDAFACEKNTVPYNLLTGFCAWYNSYQLDSVWPPPVPTPVFSYYGGSPAVEFGLYLTGAGDVDDASSLPVQSPSWDIQVGSYNGEGTFLTDPNSIAGALPFPPYISLTNYTLHPTLGTKLTEEGNEIADEVAALGDLDLDAGTHGSDEVGWVEYTGGVLPTGPSNPPVSHVVRVISYNPPPAGPPYATDLYNIFNDPVTNSPLNGTFADVRNTYNDFGGITAISKLGDVDGDGIDDFGVVSGFDDSNGQHHAVALVFATHVSMSGLTPTTGSIGSGAATIRLIGNRHAQQGSRVAISVTGCPAFATGFLYEGTSTSGTLSACGGLVRVAASNVIPFTCNMMGEFHYIRDLDYYTTNSSDLPGATWYYQALVNTTPTCTVTGIRNVRVIDSSNPLDCYPGDS